MAQNTGDVARIEREVSEALGSLAAEAAVKSCLAALRAAAPSADRDECLRSFFVCLWLIEQASRQPVGTDTVLQEAGRRCEAMLVNCGIKPASSPDSGLYGRLFTALSRARQRAG